MRRHGFTLAELLIALLILGMIATFTIPKLLSSQADSRKKAVFKESIAAFQVATDNMVKSGVIATRSHVCGTNSPVDPETYKDYINHVVRTDQSVNTNYYLLANGSRVMVFRGHVIDFHIDYNGTGVGADTYGDDKVVFHFNDCNGNYANLSAERYGTVNSLPAGLWPKTRRFGKIFSKTRVFSFWWSIR